MIDNNKICKEQEIDYGTDVELLQDGKPVPMVPFVKEIISNVVYAMAKSLDGFDPEAEITVTIRKKG